MNVKLLLAVLCCFFFFHITLFAQTPDTAGFGVGTPPQIDTEMFEESAGMHATLKEKFIEGDWRWMTPILLCFIFGLAIIIQRIIMLNLKTTNTQKLLRKLDAELSKGNIEGAEEVIKYTRGPIASIFSQGLRRSAEGIDIVEKTIISHGSVQMSLLERGLVWVSLFVSLAPMLGFLGTVVGMVVAFDNIEAAGDISPRLVAGGIKIALLTTVAGAYSGNWHEYAPFSNQQPGSFCRCSTNCCCRLAYLGCCPRIYIRYSTDFKHYMAK